MTIRQAAQSDVQCIKSLLTDATLPVEGIDPVRFLYVVCVIGDRIVGAAGLEVYGSSALLRSVVVKNDHRRAGVGAAMIERFRITAELRSVKWVYLLTTDTEMFFSQLGFNTIERTYAPKEITGCEEFRSICPASALLMRRLVQK